MTKTGLIIGRFQPFHKGHLHLIHTALKRVDQLTIAIGSSNITNKDNPFTYSQRKQMIEKVIQHESLQDKILNIIPSPDIPSDQEWTEDLVNKAGHFDIVFGNNSWTNSCLKEAGYKTVEIPYREREKYQGELIRKKMRRKEKWSNYVPAYLINCLKELQEVIF